MKQHYGRIAPQNYAVTARTKCVAGFGPVDGPETCDAFCSGSYCIILGRYTTVVLFHSFTSGKGTREGNSMSMEEAGKRNARPRKFLESTRPGKILEKHCENASW